MKKALFAVLAFALFTAVGSAQTTAVSTTGVVDSDGTTWVGAIWSMNFVVSPTEPNPTRYTNNGAPVSNSVLHQSGTLNGSGAATITVYDNTLTTPLGSQWQLSICPNATGQCSLYTFVASGTTLNITTSVNNIIIAPRFQGIAGNKGYADVEVINPTSGSTYYSTSGSAPRYYNGSVWASSGGASFPGVTSNGTGLTASGALIGGSLSSCIGSPCLTFNATAPGESVNLDWSNGYIGLLKALHGQFQVGGTDCATDSVPCNYSASVTPDAGYTIGTPIKSGNNYGVEFPTPTSPSSLQAAYGAGFIALVKANLTTTFNAMGDGPTNLSSGTGAATTATGTSASAPAMIKLTSGSTSGNPGGYSGAAVSWFTGLPVATTFTQFPAAGDFATVRSYVGFCRLCTAANLNTDAADGGAGPVGPTAMAMINYSTVRGDSVWQCVTTADGTTYSVKSITSATPSTTGSLKKVAVNNNSVVCSVGSNSVTVTTNIPSAVAINAIMYVLSLTQSAASVNIATDGWYLYYQNRSN